MKKTLILSLAAWSILGAVESELDTIKIESTTLDDVSAKEIKSADLAEALHRAVPSISLIRRSGIANDIILRGQKRDNINITMDNAKVCGACPNRMDPPTSHVLTNNIESVEVIEGPYDVENFGTLSGIVKIKTSKPTEEFHGEINLNAGSWNYAKAAATLSGGNEWVRLLISASAEKSGQYRDGNGDNFAEQLKKATDGTSMAGTQYQPKYENMDAYEKKSMMAKAFINITDNQELQLSYTANRSDNILYPNSKMDAIVDDSDIFSADYKLLNLGDLSKEFNIQAYYSTVVHPMSTQYRKASLAKGVISNELTTEVQGVKVINEMAVSNASDLTLGVDVSARNWDGYYYKNGNPINDPAGKHKDSISDTDTKNLGIFAEYELNLERLNLKTGLRYDDTLITSAKESNPENDYQDFGANIFATYATSNATKIFGGLGKASRVPDARELYFTSSMGKQVGTPDLKSTQNYQVDLGVEHKYADAEVKLRGFYSKLTDYIYYNDSKMGVNAFENIDASIYGFDISGSYFVSDASYLDLGAAYQRGQKDEALEGQTNTNLADIPPLKGHIAFIYEYAFDSLVKAEVVAADSWSEFDDDNGEQELDAYAILNLKLDHRFNNGLGIAVGVDNVFNETYAVSNTYKDLILITSDTSGEVILMNEPGRYFYANLSLKF
ncbi:MAG: TonB-dependent receptor [Campylobacterota bacterium]|nr:TonB-dependent receptor [Campylobacterota bacterium]